MAESTVSKNIQWLNKGAANPPPTTEPKQKRKRKSKDGEAK